MSTLSFEQFVVCGTSRPLTSVPWNKSSVRSYEAKFGTGLKNLQRRSLWGWWWGWRREGDGEGEWWCSLGMEDDGRREFGRLRRKLLPKFSSYIAGAPDLEGVRRPESWNFRVTTFGVTKYSRCALFSLYYVVSRGIPDAVTETVFVEESSKTEESLPNENEEIVICSYRQRRMQWKGEEKQ